MRRAMLTAREEEAREEGESSLLERITNFDHRIYPSRACITYLAPFTCDAPCYTTLLLKLVWLRLVPQSKRLSEIFMTMTKYFFEFCLAVGSRVRGFWFRGFKNFGLAARAGRSCSTQKVIPNVY